MHLNTLLFIAVTMAIPASMANGDTNITSRVSTSAVRSNARAVCYCPFHSDGYPHRIKEVLEEDFTVIKKYANVIRTYYANYYGEPIMPHAANAGLKVYIGVYMTREPWFESQIQSAIDGAINHPNHVLGIFVGNENVRTVHGDNNGKFSADEIINTINRIRNALRQRGIDTPVGTVQRITEWVSDADSYEIGRLGDAADLIGANIYPFFSGGWQIDNPTASLDLQWNQLVQKYYAKVEKLRLAETGWPSDGGDSSIFPQNTFPANRPCIENAGVFYNALLEWRPSQGDTEKMHFSFFDRRPDEPIVTGGPKYEQYFGLADRWGNPKQFLRPL